MHPSKGSQKIILFLSDYKLPKEGGSLDSFRYTCPDNSVVEGIQTNDAPVRYLLRSCPAVSEILCIVTPVARAAAWEPFVQMVHSDFPEVSVTDIPFEGGNDFGESTLPKIMSAVAPGDEILLETTGGFRNAIMHLLLISRVLSYSGIPTAKAVYSNFQTKRVEDISHLTGLFELVGGMQEMAGSGSVRTLRDYYRLQPDADPAIDKLLTAMEQLQEDITLCRTQQIEERLKAFDDALEKAEACADPLMRALLPAFRSKFGKKLSVPGLIKWCVNNNMLQQALTLYKEQIPAYIVEHSHLLQLRENAPQPKIRPYQNVEEVRFYSQLLNMGQKLPGARCDADPNWENGQRKNPLILTLDRLEEALPYSCFTAKCPIDQLRKVLMDYLYIRMLRNMINHANEQGTPEERSLMDYLSDSYPLRYKKLEKIRAEDIRQALLNALDNLQPQPRKRRKR